MGFQLNIEVQLDSKSAMVLGLLNFVLKESSVTANRKQSVDLVVVLIKTLTEADRSDLLGVRHDLSIELPLSWLCRVTQVLALFEKSNEVPGVRASEELAIGTQDDLLDGVSLAVFRNN